MDIAGSSNGRTWAFGAQYLGSNPSPAAMKCLVVTMAIGLLALFIYVLAVTFWNQNRLRKIRSTSGGLMSGVEAEVKVQEQKARALLLGFAPTEALPGVVNVAIAATAILGLFYSSGSR